MLPSGAAGKNVIREITRLLNSWVNDSPLNEVSMKEGKNIEKLMQEAETLQSKLPSSSKSKDIENISNHFKDMLQRGNVNGATKLITNNMSGRIVPLNNETIVDLLRKKHPASRNVNEDNALPGACLTVDLIVYDVIKKPL